MVEFDGMLYLCELGLGVDCGYVVKLMDGLCLLVNGLVDLRLRKIWSWAGCTK